MQTRFDLGLFLLVLLGAATAAEAQVISDVKPFRPIVWKRRYRFTWCEHRARPSTTHRCYRRPARASGGTAQSR
jgi:hypothetical protein